MNAATIARWRRAKRRASKFFRLWVRLERGQRPTRHAWRHRALAAQLAADAAWDDVVINL